MSILSQAIQSLSYEKIESFMRKVLPLFFVCTFTTTAVGACVGYLEHHSWKVGDWLINYQGGMIRRGFLGELSIQLAQLSQINPGRYVLLFQIFFYAAFFFFSYALLKKQHVLMPYALLIFSPFIFMFQINDLGGGYRKEIIYIAILAFITWSAKTHKKEVFEKLFFATLLLYPAVILTHEMLAIFLPYLLVVYTASTHVTKRKFIVIVVLLVPSIMSFFMSLYYPGTPTQEAEILQSIARENYAIKKGGSISWIQYSATQVEEYTKAMAWNSYYISYYVQALLLSIIAYLPIRKSLLIVFKKKLSLTLLLIAIFGTFPLFIVAIDWGRFIYIHLVSIYFLTFLATCPSLKSQEPFSVKVHTPYVQDWVKLRNYFVMPAFFITYSLLWRIPHCCYPNPYAQNYRQINIVAFTKPYDLFFSHFL